MSPKKREFDQPVEMPEEPTPIPTVEAAPEPAPVVEPPAPMPAPVPVAAPPQVVSAAVTFETYCALKGIPVRRRAGMRAYTKLTRATYEEWESAFKNY